MLQQKVYGATRAQYHIPVMFKGSNPPWEPWEPALLPHTWLPKVTPQILFTDGGSFRQRAGLSIYYIKAEWQNLLNSGPCWSTSRSNRSYNNQQQKDCCTESLSILKPWQRIPFPLLYQLKKNSGQEKSSIPYALQGIQTLNLPSQWSPFKNYVYLFTYLLWERKRRCTCHGAHVERTGQLREKQIFPSTRWSWIRLSGFIEGVFACWTILLANPSMITF